MRHQGVRRRPGRRTIRPEPACGRSSASAATRRRPTATSSRSTTVIPGVACWLPAQPDTLGAQPTFLGAGGFKAFIQPWLGITTYSAKHWLNTDHTVVAPLGSKSDDTDQQPGLAWIDLENASALPSGQNPFTVLKGTAWNWIYPPTAGKYAAAPSWSHLPANDFVLFTATSNVRSGRLGTGTAHLYEVPYSKTATQAATPIPGPRRRDQPEVRAVLWLAVVRRRLYRLRPGSGGHRRGYPPGPEQRRYGVQRHVHLGRHVHAAGRRDLRHADVRRAGHPTGGERSGQLPRPAAARGRSTTPGPSGRRKSRITTAPPTTGSSSRRGARAPRTPAAAPIAQLFMTAIVKPEVGPIQTYPAVYLWNQPSNVSNFTPAWDVFEIGNVG